MHAANLRSQAQLVASPPSTSRPTVRPNPTLRSRRPSPNKALGELGEQLLEQGGARHYNWRHDVQENVDPDYDNPNWISNATDWWEFWNNTVWEQELEELDDGQDEAASAGVALARAEKLISAVADFDKRNDVVRILPPLLDEKDNGYFTSYESPPEAEGPDKNPKLSLSDVRAMVEKRKKFGLLDAEWRRRQSLIGKFQYQHGTRYVADIRMQRAEPERDDWTDEEVMKLITLDGLNCHPDDHQGVVENPLAPCDYVNTFGVDHIEDTEEFARRIGHWVEDDEVDMLNVEVELQESDLLHPEEAVGGANSQFFFGSSSGGGIGGRPQAPVPQYNRTNVWAHANAERQQEEAAAAAKTRRRGAAATAALLSETTAAATAAKKKGGRRKAVAAAAEKEPADE